MSNLGILVVSKEADLWLDLVQWDQCLLLTASPWYNTTTMGFALSDMKYEGNQIGVIKCYRRAFLPLGGTAIELRLVTKVSRIFSINRSTTTWKVGKQQVS